MSLSARPQRRVLVTKINRSQSFAGVNSTADRPFRWETGAHAACHEGRERGWGQAAARRRDLLRVPRRLPNPLSSGDLRGPQGMGRGGLWGASRPDGRQSPSPQASAVPCPGRGEDPAAPGPLPPEHRGQV